MHEETITEKLEKFEKYIRRAKFHYYPSKKLMISMFHFMFQEEMKDTETGKKWRKKFDS